MKILAYQNLEGSNEFKLFFTLDNAAVSHCIVKNFHSITEMLHTTPRIQMTQAIWRDGYQSGITNIQEFKKIVRKCKYLPKSNI